MSRDCSRWMFLSFAAAVVLLGRAIPAAFDDGMPQVRGEDVLAQVLGETRLAVSQALLAKADEYFHGGVRHKDCDHGLTECGYDEHDHDHEHDANEHDAHHKFDPWCIINRRVHVQEHRHMKGAEAKELLPWLWAANRMSADNLQSIQASVYVLNSMLGNPAAARDMLQQGIAKNPCSADLEFVLGELYLRSFKDGAKAETAFRAALEKNILQNDEDARLLRLRTLFYLGYLSKLKGDIAGLRQHLLEAEELSPQHICTRDLRNLLQQSEGP
ncbi:MAG: hypothetical protein PHU80_02340 [Kiritimatiellae bacterium]|nr:hypothetical protein [Kiritimatiellia bacterium]